MTDHMTFKISCFLQYLVKLTFPGYERKQYATYRGKHIKYELYLGLVRDNIK